MDKDERLNKTLKLSELLNNTVLNDKFNKTVYSDIAKQATIFSFWDNVTGKKLASLSKPYKIKASKIYISTKSATVSQQIFLLKNKIVEKINTYSKPLGIEIKEIAVTYKNYNEITSPKEIPQEEKMVFIDDGKFKNIKIDDGLIESIKESVAKIKLLNDKQKEALVEKILNNYKAEEYRKNIQNG